jgi:hydroxyacyl-ACP dehydratase HTD2-like protein with hotdog domain
MLDLLRRERPAPALRRFDFRAVSAVHVERPISACAGEPGDGALPLWIAHAAGGLAMTGTVGTA